VDAAALGGVISTIWRQRRQIQAAAQQAAYCLYYI